MMRLRLGLLMVWLLTIAGTARADQILQPFQVIAAVHAASEPLDAKKVLRIRASGMGFLVPQTKDYNLIGYVGPRFDLPTPGFWLSPQVGVITRWGPNHVTAFLASFWAYLPLAHEVIQVFLEADGYFAKNVANYYGYYAVTFAPPWKVPLTFGVGVEQNDGSVTFGPQASLTIGPVWMSLQYYVGNASQDMTHTLRLAFALFL